MASNNMLLSNRKMAKKQYIRIFKVPPVLRNDWMSLAFIPRCYIAGTSANFPTSLRRLFEERRRLALLANK